MAGGEFLTKDEEQRLSDEIAKAELKTTGEIRVHLAKKASKHGVMADAAVTFHKLGMDKTRFKNAVLIHVATEAHELAIIGDAGIHKLIGDHGWKDLVEELKGHFAKGERYLGLHLTIEKVGIVLATHFPADGAHNPNELPNEISRD